MKNIVFVFLLFLSISLFGQANIGVDGALHPSGSFPIALTSEIKGAAKQVADLTARDAISTNLRVEGMEVYVTSTQSFYTLIGGIANGNWTLRAAVTSINGNSGAITLTKTDVGLSVVDNTADANKPVSSATRSGLDSMAKKTKLYDLDTLKFRTQNSNTIGFQCWVGGNGSMNWLDNPTYNYMSNYAGNGDIIMFTGQNTTNPSRITGAGALRGIYGGYDNEIVGNLANDIVAGHHNYIGANVTHALNMGGNLNRSFRGDYTTLVGGSNNSLSGQYGFIGGGNLNGIRGNYSASIAGYNSQQDTLTNYVFFGTTNNASISSNYGAILSGDSNRILTGAQYSYIVGGQKNEVSAGALMSSADGYAARTVNVGQKAFANGFFDSKGDCQLSTYVVKEQIGAAGAAELRLSNTTNGRFNRIALPNGSRCAFVATVIATNITNNEEAMYRVEGVAVTKAGVTTIKNLTKTVIFEDDAAWDVNVTNTANSLNIVGVGDATDVTRWAAEVRTVIIIY